MTRVLRRTAFALAAAAMAVSAGTASQLTVTTNMIAAQPTIDDRSEAQLGDTSNRRTGDI